MCSKAFWHYWDSWAARRTNYSKSPIEMSIWFVEIWFHRLSRSRTFARTGSSPAPERLTFTRKMTALNANLRVLAGKLHNVTFGVNTRNITRLIKTPISHWFIRVFDEPVFLLIRRSLVRAQVEEPPKKASSNAMLFPFIRNYLSRWGPLGDFLPSNFIELLHVYYTVDGISQEV